MDMAHKLHTSEDYHRFGDVRSVSRGRRSSTPQTSPRHTSPMRAPVAVPPLPLPPTETLQPGIAMPAGNQPYNDPQESKPELYDKYTYALKRREPSHGGSPSQKPAPEPQTMPSLPMPPLPQPYPDPLALGPLPSAVWPLSNSPDPQGRKVAAYKNTDYASRRQHPKQLGYSSPVKKLSGPKKPRAKSQRKAVPLPPPPPCWEAFVTMAEANGIKHRDIGLLFWDTAEQLCLHFGINDPVELAAIQDEWRRRHTGTDNPPPIVPPEPVPLPLDLLPPPPIPVPIPVPAPLPVPIPAYVPVEHLVHSPVPLPVPYPVATPLPVAPPIHEEYSPHPVTPSYISSPAKSTPSKSLPRGKLDWGAKAKVDTGLRR